MADDRDVFLFLATYGAEADAKIDFKAVKKLHADGTLDSYDAAVVTKHPDGNIDINRHELPTKKGGLTGLAVGALAGVLLPVSLIAGAAVGGVSGGLLGHFWAGMPRKDIKELGEVMDGGTAALVVIGRSDCTDCIQSAITHADAMVMRHLEMDGAELDMQLLEAQKALDNQ